MATDATKVMAGAAVVKVGAWTSSGAAASLTDVGLTATATELAAAFENFDVEAEQATGIIKTVPIKQDFTVKFDILETVPENLRMALRLATAQLTGTAPNQTLSVIDAVEQYHQVTLTAPGPGTNKVRTLTLWKCQAASIEPISFAKAGTQKYGVTMRLMRDDTCTAAQGLYFKQVDT